MSTLTRAVFALVYFVGLITCQCIYKNKTYETGQRWKEEACTDCYCPEDGVVQCVITMCAPICVDWESHPDYCCGYCPNGRNCRAPDGTIIKHGETKVTSDGQKCSCGFYSTTAICTTLVQ